MAMQRLLLAQRLLFRLQSRRVGVGLAAAVSAALARVATLSSEPGESSIKINPLVLDAVAGAAGEIAQVAALYPMDTIKVRSQAHGSSMAREVAALFKTFRQTPLMTFRALYAGCPTAAAASALIGAVYLVSFCAAKRLGTRLQEQGDLNLGLVTRPVAAAWQQLQPPGPDAVAKASISVAGGPLGVVEKADELLPPADTAQVAGMDAGAQSAVVSMGSAVFSSIVTSIFDAPVEMFRHRVQAGQLRGSIAGAMAASVQRGGLGSLYWGYAPFLFKALPYDTTELFTYSQLREHREHLPLLRDLSENSADLLLGAISGAAACITSMPADCVKTRIEMSLAKTKKAPSLVTSSLAFLKMGRSMMRHGGVGSLYVGILPRLCDKVPSSMVYWFAVENMHRLLLPYCPELLAAESS